MFGLGEEDWHYYNSFSKICLNKNYVRTLDKNKNLTKINTGTSLVAQWLRIRLPMQGHGFKPWPRKIPHAVEQLSLRATTPEPVL